MANRYVFLLMIVILFSNQIIIYGSGSKNITFGVVPQQSAQKLAKQWMPLFKYLSERTGYNIVFATATNIPEFEKRTAKGGYDIAYMNPYHYCVFNRSAGYKAFAKEKNRYVKGIIVVRKDSPIKDLSGLEGKTLAFPSPAAFGASILTRGNLKKLGINFTPKYVESHDSVYRVVAKDLYAGGGGVVSTFMEMDTSITDQLRIIWTSAPYAPHAFAAHPGVPDEVVSEILKAMIQMNEDPSARSVLKEIDFNGFESAKNNDWNDVRNLDIDALDYLINK